MQDLSDEDRREVFGEVLMDELKVIREYLEHLQPLPDKVARLEEAMAEVQSDLGAIKAAVTGQGRQVQNHERRITRLEAAR